jgi:hypothetical protein
MDSRLKEFKNLTSALEKETRPVQCLQILSKIRKIVTFANPNFKSAETIKRITRLTEETNNPYLQEVMCWIYFNGFCTDKSYKEASKWASLGARNGNLYSKMMAPALEPFGQKV